MSSKKTFKENPAMQFISASDEQSNFSSTRDNSEISESQEAKQESHSVPIQETKTPPLETRSKRFNMLIQPSLYKLLQKRAKEKKISCNELAHQILEFYLKNNPKL